MTATPFCPTAHDLLMVQYQEDVLQGIADQYGLSVAEVGVMAAAFLSGVGGQDLAEIRRAARRGYHRWVAEEAREAAAY
jgi:hypothetical protein